jgi:hypothetical protein
MQTTAVVELHPERWMPSLPTIAAPISAPPSVPMLARSSPTAEPARPVDALQALLAALADRDQLGLDLAAALDREADSVSLGASGHFMQCRVQLSSMSLLRRSRPVWLPTRRYGSRSSTADDLC